MWPESSPGFLTGALFCNCYVACLSYVPDIFCLFVASFIRFFRSPWSSSESLEVSDTLSPTDDSSLPRSSFDALVGAAPPAVLFRLPTSTEGISRSLIMNFPVSLTITISYFAATSSSIKASSPSSCFAPSLVLECRDFYIARSLILMKGFSTK